ncbi:prophage integrase [Salmonella enterica subsp. enterica]|uniref:Prophage integrase n=1 Tax=Salmonella enterica I TaxID=59201 RepID=A0A3S4F1H0_SALET|nr:prophage integrase [Salmonella enterica subsp. enterica]
MAKIAKKLTDTEIKSTKPADKEINLFDGDGLIFTYRSFGERRQEKLVF